MYLLIADFVALWSPQGKGLRAEAISIRELDGTVAKELDLILE
jgi:hypothetical protein